MRWREMKLIKLYVLGEFTMYKSTVELYINADKIISAIPNNTYSEIAVAYPERLRMFKVANTIEDIQSQLEGKPAEVYIDKHKVGKRIQAIRFSKGMDQKQFSDSIHATVSALSNWENGNNLPNKARLKNIADLAGITVQKLLEG